MSEEQTQQQNNQTRRRKSRRQLSSTQVMFAVILAIALMLAVQFSSRISEERNLTRIRDTVEEEIEFLRNEQAELIDELNFVQSDAYVEQWARGEGRMVRDNMVLLIPLPASSTVVEETPAEENEVTQPPLQLETEFPDPEPWQLWWALFFDMSPPQFGG